MAEVSVIFVNWNSSGYLRECLASIAEHTHDVDYETVVVDNASPADDVDQLKADFPYIQLVKSQTNLGFSGANNVGFRQSSGKYVLFLNPDTKLVGPAICTMLDHMKKLSDAGIVGSKLLNSDLSVQTESVQRFPRILNQLLDAEYLRLRWPDCRLWQIGALFRDCQEPVRVEVIPGACMLLKRDVFEAAGLFTEDYFMYAEDIDLNYKVARLGLASYYIGTATIIHHGGTSSRQQKVSQWSTAMKFRAMVRFFRIRRGRWYAGLYRTSMACAAMGRLAALAVARCFSSPARNRERIEQASAKWTTVLRCAMGISS